MGRGDPRFIELNCSYHNCYVTDNRTYLSDIRHFDAIVFHGTDVINMNYNQLPNKRSPSQKYVFGATESAQRIIVCDPVLENFFNWTWTHKLDSDIRWSHILIYNLDGHEVGPTLNMKWPKKMNPVKNKKIRAILDGKTKAAAWFASQCQTLGKRENFAKTLKQELSKLKLKLDVYGKCGKLKCAKDNLNQCYDLVKRHYYFYLSFESYVSTDYVTEKLLIALNNFAIPVVYGGADYSRFLPPGSYLNARELGPKQLAKTMEEIIKNRTRFYDYFRWRNHFRYKARGLLNEICNICTALNDDKKAKNYYHLNIFRRWWNEQYNNRCNNKKELYDE
nr:alpha-(1,3)-fucosyltransferase C-like [Plodia interpunctella]